MPLSNPLAVVFGLTLERLRTQVAAEPLSSHDMAKTLGLTYGTYRLTETANVLLRISRSLSLARKLQLDWRRLVRILAAIQVLEEANSSTEEMKRRAAELSVHDDKLHPFLAYSDSVWRLVETNTLPTDLAACREVQEIANGLAAFLSGTTAQASHDRRPEPPTHWTEPVQGIPPYYLEALRPVRTLLNSFRSMPPPQIDVQHLSEFEQFNSFRMWRHYAILRDPSVLEFVNREQPEFSSWPYLLRPQFEFLEIAIAFGASLREKGIHRRFMRDLRQNWQRTNPEVTDKEAERILQEKVRIRVLPADHPLHDFLWYDLNRGTRAPRSSPGVVGLNNVWLYCLRDPSNAVAWIDTFRPGSRGPLFAASCSWEFTEELAKVVHQYWSP